MADDSKAAENLLACEGRRVMRLVAMLDRANSSNDSEIAVLIGDKMCKQLRFVPCSGSDRCEEDLPTV